MIIDFYESALVGGSDLFLILSACWLFFGLVLGSGFVLSTYGIYNLRYFWLLASGLSYLEFARPLGQGRARS